MALKVDCPNENLKEWKNLVKEVGKDKAHIAYFRYGNKIPSVAEATKLLTDIVEPTKKNPKSPFKSYNHDQQIRTFSYDKLALMSENPEIKPRDIKLRFRNFALKHFYGPETFTRSYREQIDRAVDKIKEPGDYYHKQAINLVNEFIQWDNARGQWTKFQAFYNKNIKKLSDKSIPGMGPLHDQFNEVERKYNEFAYYQTLVGLENRGGATMHPKARFSDALAEPSDNMKKYKTGISDETIRSAFNEKKDRQEYQITDKGRQKIKELRAKFNKDEGAFDAEHIRQELDNLKEKYKEVTGVIKDYKEEKVATSDEHINQAKEELIANKTIKDDSEIIRNVFRSSSKHTTAWMFEDARSVAEGLDGVGKAGAFTKLWKNLKDASYKRKQVVAQSKDFLKNNLINVIGYDKIKQYSEGFHYGLGDVLSKRNVPRIDWELSNGEKIQINRSQRVAMYMYSKVEGAMDHILNGGIALGQDTAKIYKVTADQYKQLIDSMTDEEKHVAQVLFDYYSMRGKMINEVSVKEIGRELADPTKPYLHITTRASLRKGDKGLKSVDSIEQIANFGTSDGNSIKPGSLVAKIKSDVPIVLKGAFEEMADTDPAIEKYIAYAKELPLARRFLKGVENEMVRRGLSPELTYLKKWVQRIEDPKAFHSIGSGWIYKLDKWFIPQALSWNMRVVAIQQHSMFLYATRMGVSAYQDMGGAVKDLITRRNPLEVKKTFELIKKYSPELRDRYEGGRSSMDIMDSSSGANMRARFGLEHKGLKRLASIEGGLDPIQTSDAVCTMSFWKFSENRVARMFPELEKGTDEYYKKVAQLTEDANREGLPTYDEIDRPLLHSIPVVRQLTYFAGQRMKMCQIIIRGMRMMQQSKQSGKFDSNMFSQGLHNVFVAGVVVPAFVASVRVLVDSARGKFDEDKLKDPWWYAEQFGEASIGALSIPGQIAAAAFNQFKSDSSGPWGTSIGFMQDLARTVWSDIKTQRFEGQKFLRFLKIIKDSMPPVKNIENTIIQPIENVWNTVMKQIKNQGDSNE